MVCNKQEAADKRLLQSTNCAVVIIDVQNDYCHEDGSCAKAGKDVSNAQSIIGPTRRLTKIAAKKNFPVIYVRTLHDTSTDSDAWLKRMNGNTNYICRENTWGSQFYELCPGEKDVIVTKHRYSAFIGTKLETVLHTYKIDTILITGVATNVCVESTLRDGFMLDYNVMLVEDCCAAFSSEEHQTAVKNIKKYFGSVVTVEQIEQMLV